MTLNIRRGEFVCIIGDVGSGKTSLLNCITNNMLYTDGLFYQQFCNETIDDIKDDLVHDSKKQLPKYQAPIVISESVSLV